MQSAKLFLMLSDDELDSTMNANYIYECDRWIKCTLKERKRESIRCLFINLKDFLDELIKEIIQVITEVLSNLLKYIINDITHSNIYHMGIISVFLLFLIYVTISY